MVLIHFFISSIISSVNLVESRRILSCDHRLSLFLTTWSYCTVFLHFLLSAIIVCTHHVVLLYSIPPLPAVRNHRLYSPRGPTVHYSSTSCCPQSLSVLTTWSYCTVFLHFPLSAIIVCTHHVSAYCQRSRPSTAIKNRRGSDVFSKQDGSPDTNDILHEDTSNSSESNTSTDTRWRILKRVTISISWIFANVVFVFVIVVTAVYYTAICPKDVTCGRYFNINVHALNTVFIIVDVVISARPVRMCHVVYPFIIGFIYVMFSVFFWASDHTHVIYRVVLNWNKPGMTAGVLIGASIGIVLLHALHLGIYKLKLYVHKRDVRNKSQRKKSVRLLSSFFVE
ncbi:uncharacterized protein LOC125380963 [Haliotis rufescens]|uniref:uncharacterized protein LOC125380963 n=1 Tax=Haliotis rufescens TaxID=6454 RepID=UPI00201F6EBC|nr:uncharacterized protein LOC125380963 [Haliotis rufescens]